MPNSPSRLTFPSCAAPRIRRKWWRAPTSLGLPPSASPTAILLPAWCALTTKRASETSSSSSARGWSPVDGFEVLAYPTDRAAYGRLCRLITTGNLKAKKGECALAFEQILSAGEGQIFIVIPPQQFPGRSAARNAVEWCAADPGSSPTPSVERSRISGAAFHAAPRPGNDSDFIRPPRSLGPRRPRPHLSRRRPLSSRRRAAPARTVGRTRRTARCAARCRQRRYLSRTGAPAARRRAHLRAGKMHIGRSRPAARRQCRTAPQAALGNGAAVRRIFPTPSPAPSMIAEACHFSLGELKYEYPDEPVPEGKTAQQHLEDLTWAGARERYSQDHLSRKASLADVQKRLHDELALIAKLDYARYFLTVHDVVAFARNQKQGNPLPGPRLGGQQRGVLLPRHHLGQSGQEQPLVRPLHFREPRRTARYRRRFRARAARGSDPVHLPALRPPSRGDLRNRGALPLAPRHPRSRQGAWV